MPIYEYTRAGTSAGCELCGGSFTVLQRMTDPKLEVCPRCGQPVDRLIPSGIGVAAPHTNSELKNLGFTKLVKRDQGVYENVTATHKESRYMEAGKSETLPDLKSKIAD